MYGWTHEKDGHLLGSNPSYINLRIRRLPGTYILVCKYLNSGLCTPNTACSNLQHKADGGNNLNIGSIKKNTIRLYSLALLALLALLAIPINYL